MYVYKLATPIRCLEGSQQEQKVFLIAKPSFHPQFLVSIIVFFFLRNELRRKFKDNFDGL